MILDAPSRGRQLANKAEAAFAREVEGANKTWIYQPRQFKLPRPFRSYRPDFYVIEDECFYEVVGTRQAYSQRREQIASFRATYPNLRLEVVAPLGVWLHGPQAPRVKHVRQSYAPRKRVMLERLGNAPNGSVAARIQALMCEHAIASLADLARRTGVGYWSIKYATNCGDSRRGEEVLAKLRAAFEPAIATTALEAPGLALERANCEADGVEHELLDPDIRKKGPR